MISKIIEVVLIVLFSYRSSVTEAVIRRCSIEKFIWNIQEDSQENPYFYENLKGFRLKNPLHGYDASLIVILFEKCELYTACFE